MLPLIYYIFNYNNYIKYRYIIKLNKDQKELSVLLKELDYLMDKYKRDVSLAEFRLHVLNRHPDLEPFVDALGNETIDEEFLQDTIKEIQQKQLCYSLAEIAVEAAEGRKPVDSVLSFFDNFERVETPDEADAFITDNLEDLYEDTIASPGLRWRLKILNKALGSLRKGDFGFLFARPETGKTTFLASEVTHFASQAEAPILWFNNEEQGNKVKVRLYQAALGLTLPELFADRERSYQEFMRITKGNIKLLDSASIHKRQVERIVKEIKPSLIVFDQIDKIKGFDNDREDLRLGSIYIWARELAKEYCPVIGVCQADVSGEGKRWLTMDNVANAKTSKQAEADWILGIGKLHDEGYDQLRFLHLSKNKLTGDEDSDSSLRHGKLDAIILPEIARYKDTING